MIELVRSLPASAFVLWGVGLVVVMGLRSRLLPYALVAGLALLAIGTELACFDGRPHLTEKFDATLFAWARTLQLRGAVGALGLILCIPLGQAVGRLAGPSMRPRTGGLWGGLVLGSFSLGLLGSSVHVLSTFPTVLAVERPATERLAMLSRAVDASCLGLTLAAALASLTATVMALRLLRAARSS